MTDKEFEKQLTDSEIEKALECCSQEFGQCVDCPLFEVQVDCVVGNILEKHALDYIERLKAENEQLRKDNADLSAIVKANKLCVTPKHCPNQDEIRKETAKEIFDYINQSGVINVAPDTIKMYFKEHFGIEVEE